MPHIRKVLRCRHRIKQHGHPISGAADRSAIEACRQVLSEVCFAQTRPDIFGD